jgi:hypothetical protein
MWLCNLFTILMCLATVDSCDAVQQQRYGQLMTPPRQRVLDEAYVPPPKPEENPIPTNTVDPDRR